VLIEDMAGDLCERRDVEGEVLGINIGGTGDESGGELLVLIEVRREIAALRSIKGIFSSGNVGEFEAAIVGGKHRLHWFAGAGILDGNASPSQGVASSGADYSAGNAVGRLG